MLVCPSRNFRTRQRNAINCEKLMRYSEQQACKWSSDVLRWRGRSPRSCHFAGTRSIGKSQERGNESRQWGKCASDLYSASCCIFTCGWVYPTNWVRQRRATARCEANNSRCARMSRLNGLMVVEYRKLSTCGFQWTYRDGAQRRFAYVYSRLFHEIYGRFNAGFGILIAVFCRNL